jgi:hypothetical protein
MAEQYQHLAARLVCQRQKHPVHLLEGGRRLFYMHTQFLAAKLILSKRAKHVDARHPDVRAAQPP